MRDRRNRALSIQLPDAPSLKTHVHHRELRRRARAGTERGGGTGAIF